MADEEKTSDQHARVSCMTSKGVFVMDFHREWSPLGFDRAVSLFEKGVFRAFAYNGPAGLYDLLMFAVTPLASSIGLVHRFLRLVRDVSNSCVLSRCELQGSLIIPTSFE
jgi:hypothetical protein